VAYAGGLESRYTSSATSLVHVRKFINAFRASGVFIWSEDVPRGQEGKLSRPQGEGVIAPRGESGGESNLEARLAVARRRATAADRRGACTPD
jgi:hypothetical protein